MATKVIYELSYQVDNDVQRPRVTRYNTKDKALTKYRQKLSNGSQASLQEVTYRDIDSITGDCK